jgi:hypothetical protein
MFHKGKIKKGNNWNLANFGPLKMDFSLNFFGSFLSLRQIRIFEISIKFSKKKKIPNMTFFKKFVFTSQRGHLSNFRHKPQLKKNAENIENCLF